MALDILNVKDFGAVGDGVTNDSPAFQMAIDEAAFQDRRGEFAASTPVYVPPVDIGYRIADTIEVRRTVKIVGAGGRWVGGSGLLVNANTTCFNIRYPEDNSAPDVYQQTPYSGVFAEINGLQIKCDDPATTSGYGILSNASCHIINCFIGDFGQDGVFVNSSIPGDDVTGNDPDPPTETEPKGYYGNANLFYLERVSCQRNKGNGFRFLGNNANAGTIISCDATKNLGCGFLDESSLGNTYLGCHAASNATMVGHNGEVYVCVQVHVSDAASEPGVAQDWRDFWQLVASSSFDIPWSVGVQFFRSGSYHSHNAAARNVYLGCYSEAGVQGPAALSKNDTVVGGNLADAAGSTTRGVNRATGQGVTVLSQESFPVVVRGRSEDFADSFKAALGGTNPIFPTFLSVGHSDDDISGIRFAYNKVRNTYEWLRDTTEKVLITFTTQNWAKDGLSGDNQVIINQGVILGGGTLSRWRSYADIASIPGGLEVTTKDFFILTGATSGQPTLAKCTTAGTVGTDAVIVGVAPLP